MTKLSGIVRREVTGPGGESFVITLTADGIMMREKGRRTAFGPLAYSFLHYTAVARTVIADRTKSTRAKRVSRSLI